MKKQWHHLIPLELGGSDSDDNYVLLATKDHADAHMGLFQRYGNGNDLSEYRRLMALHAQEQAEAPVETPAGERIRKRGEHGLLGVPKKAEHRKAISLGKRGQYLSDEARAKISKTMQGNENSKAHGSKEFKERHSKRMKASWVERKARMEALWDEEGL